MAGDRRGLCTLLQTPAGRPAGWLAGWHAAGLAAVGSTCSCARVLLNLRPRGIGARGPACACACSRKHPHTVE